MKKKKSFIVLATSNPHGFLVSNDEEKELEINSRSSASPLKCAVDPFTDLSSSNEEAFTTEVPTKYRLRSLSAASADIIQTPVLDPGLNTEGLTALQAKCVLDYFLSCGDRLSQMTKTYHDVEAVTRLLQEKENDLELAAKIGQELLERNRRLEERVAGLETQLSSSTDLITQLRHDLTVKTDLLHVYTNDAIEDLSPVEKTNFVNPHTLEKKIRDLEEENKRLQDEATELAKEAMECEAKEEKLVTDAVKHLTEANVQINYLSKKFTVKSDESSKQQEEITHLLAQVCDLQSKWKKSSSENEELGAQLRIYKETQEELTSELSDFKEKYREIVDLLHDTQNELKMAKKRSYPGIGEHKVSGMFEKSSSSKEEKNQGVDSSKNEELSLQSEIHSLLRSKKQKKSEFSTEMSSDSELDSALQPSRSKQRHHQDLKSTFATYKLATANKMHIGGLSSDSPIPSYAPGLGSSLENPSGFSIPRVMPLDDTFSYTISRDNSQSPTAFMIDLDDKQFKTRTSDTLTMTPAGACYKNRSLMDLRPMSPMSLKLDKDQLTRDETEGELSILEWDSASVDGGESIPGLGSFEERPRLGSLPGLSRPALGSVPGAGLGSVPEGLEKRRDLGAVPQQGGRMMMSDMTSQGRRAMPGFSAPIIDGEKSKLRPDLGTVPGPFAFEDSGIESSEFQDLRKEGDGNAMMDLRTNLSGSDSIPELEEVLAKLTPSEVEQRRKRMFSLSRYSFELGSDGFNSPGSSVFGKPGFNFLPYGVRTPDSLMSTGSRDLMSGSYGYGSSASWKLPDKLRIVKPLEGSLTLHQWQRLAKPSLGGIFEERKGIVMKGSRLLKDKDLVNIDEEDASSDLEDEAEVAYRLKTGATRLQQTLTNSKILHPDVTDVTSSYLRSGSRMSTSMQSSRRSSLASSMDDLRMDFGTSTFSTNIGLAWHLNERNIHGGSTLSLDQYSSMGSDLPRIRTSGSVSDVASICSLTPSVIHSPTESKSYSPTGTPLNSPDGSRPSSPRRKPDADNPGFVLGFFASLRSALYGEQQKEVIKTATLKRHKKKAGHKKLGIFKRVQEVGPERFLSPAPLTEEDSSEVESESPIVKHLDWDELVEIKPGTLTLSRGIKYNDEASSTDLFGELKPPVPKPQQSGRGPGRIVSPGDKRPGLPGAGFGVPGRTGTGALMRHDLGSVPGDAGASLINNAHRLKSKPSEDGSFIGTLTSMFFGRKGGLL